MSRFRKYYFNENKLNVIDSFSKAYWLGFLIGDGSVVKQSLILELSRIDYNHIEKLKKWFECQPNHPIYYTSKNCCKINLNSMVLIKNISKHGLVNNKTPKTFTPKTIPDKYLIDFYRGILDSDGWICEHKSKKGKSQFEFGFSSGSESFIKEIQNWIWSVLNKECGYLKLREKGNQKCWQFIVGGRQNYKKLHEIFYLNSSSESRLDRKYIKSKMFYQQILKEENE